MGNVLSLHASRAASRAIGPARRRDLPICCGFPTLFWWVRQRVRLLGGPGAAACELSSIARIRQQLLLRLLAVIRCPIEISQFFHLCLRAMFHFPVRVAPAGPDASPGICGRSSVIVNQGALLATCMWTFGRIPGSSSRAPSGKPR